MTLHTALDALESLLSAAETSLRPGFLGADGKLDAEKLNEGQMRLHALAFLATEVEAASVLVDMAKRTGDAGARRIANAYVAELVRTLPGGVDLGPGESVALAELGVSDALVRETLGSEAVVAFSREHGSSAVLEDIGRGASGAQGRGTSVDGLDETLRDVRAEFAKFVDAEVIPRAQDIHRNDVLIPMELVNRMAELGVFGLTIPESYGGLGLSKVAMCVVTEELSRGYIGVGSLGTRAEIAAELILGGGTGAQKNEWLPKIASGEVLPTAVFTEPNHGSDLARIRTRAERAEDGSYRVSGQKTWITHAVRADLMTLLARTDASKPGYEGVSMFLATKTRCGGEPGTPEFVDAGLTGTEIKVLGYRGMKEYELSFDGFAVAKGALLGGQEGAGFKQLMRTFESARIQTAARGVGLAQAALDDAVRYAQERVQFGKPLISFPRVARKIGRMVVLTQAARQLTYHAAARKDSGVRSDLEAGMAKLLATRAAWIAADANVQIHGGNGYAEEYLASRLLVDARVLSIFEGANEIQAHVIARRLLET